MAFFLYVLQHSILGHLLYLHVNEDGRRYRRQNHRRCHRCCYIQSTYIYKEGMKMQPIYFINLR